MDFSPYLHSHLFNYLSCHCFHSGQITTSSQIIAYIFTIDLLLLPPPPLLSYTHFSLYPTPVVISKLKLNLNIPAQKSPTSPHLNTSRSQILAVAHKPCVISPGSSLVLLLPLSLSHSTTAILASWLFLKPATYSQTSGPSTSLCLLPEKFFSSITT